MPVRRFFLIAVVALSVGLAGLGPVSAADDEDGAGKFISSLAGRALAVLKEEGISNQERTKRFRSILRERFALKAIAAFCLQRFWHRTTPEQRAVYLPLFEEFVALTYSARLGSIYGGQALEIVKVNPDGKNGARVHSKIVSPDGTDPIRIDWRVRQPNSEYKVVDVLIEGLSMSISQRDAFVSIILRHNGEVQGLIDVLREKVAKLRLDDSS